MSGVKLLNLDDLVVVKRVIQLGGKDYPVAEQTIGEMLARLSLAKEAESVTNDPVKILQSLRDTARQILPTMEENLVDSLNMNQIVRLIEFVNEADAEVAAKAAERTAEEITEQEMDGKK